jgi:metal-responsive CopG/Arc/MetJ family transcriptional regulator
MPRGRVKKIECKLVNFYCQDDLLPILDQAVRKLDTDRSKFIRQAMREKILRAGITMPTEIAS